MSLRANRVGFALGGDGGFHCFCFYFLILVVFRCECGVLSTFVII